MTKKAGYLSRREQQIMELVHLRGQVTAADLMGALPGSPTNSTVRTLLRIMETRGLLSHSEEEGRYVYRAAESRELAAKKALSGIVRTLFRGSVSDVVLTLLEDEGGRLTAEEFNRLEKLIADAKERGK